jgi:hypothetical protein
MGDYVRVFSLGLGRAEPVNVDNTNVCACSLNDNDDAEILFLPEIYAEVERALGRIFKLVGWSWLSMQLTVRLCVSQA